MSAVAPICFPSDAKVRRFTGGTAQHAIVTMEDLRIGDTVSDTTLG
jgi:hypothetical protein